VTGPGGAPDVGAPWALFLDFDGTLVDIAPTPSGVVVPPALPGRLARLRDRLGGALAIVTGRPIADVDAFLPGFDASGMHGLERRVSGVISRPDFPALADEIEALRQRLARFDRIIIEDKRIGVAVHWRTEPAAEAEARAAIADLARTLGPPYRVQDGKAVSEIVPGGAHKGDGIRALLTTSPYAGRRPIFVGDDRTDEHGFAAVQALGGVAVKVGDGPTGAKRRVASVSMFAAVLDAWAEKGIDPDRLHPA
jgi:trehalose 6-phosphate phosphatase